MPEAVVSAPTPQNPKGGTPSIPKSSATNRAAATAALKEARAKAASAPQAEPEAAAAAPEPQATPEVAGEAAPAPYVDPFAAARKRAAEKFRAVERNRREKQEATESAKKRQAEIDARAAALEAKDAELRAKTENTQRLVKEKPFEYLESLGITAEQLVERGIKRGSPEAAREAKEAALEAKLGEFEKWKSDFLAEQKANAEKQTKEQHEQMLKSERRTIDGLVETHWKSMPHVSEMDPETVFNKVLAYGRQYFQENGEEPDRMDMLLLVDNDEEARKAKLRLKRQGAASPVQTSASAGSVGERPAGHQPTTQSTPAQAPTRGSSREDKRKAAAALLSRAKRG